MLFKKLFTYKEAERENSGSPTRLLEARKSTKSIEWSEIFMVCGALGSKFEQVYENLKSSSGTSIKIEINRNRSLRRRQSQKRDNEW